MVIITLAGNLSGEVVVDAGVLHLLPGPAVLHHTVLYYTVLYSSVLYCTCTMLENCSFMLVMLPAL